MPKVQKSTQSITPLAEVYFINEAFSKSGMSKLIDTKLGIRSIFGYQYSEIFSTIFNLFYCNGDCMEDIQVHLRTTLESTPSSKTPSADTLLRDIKELSTKR